MHESPKKLKKTNKILTIHVPRKDFFNLNKITTSKKIMKLKGYDVIMNYGHISINELAYSDIIMLFCPRAKMRPSDLLLLEKYVTQGGRVFVALNGPKEGNSIPDINDFLENYGISFNKDHVVRTMRYGKYLHPKEAIIFDGVVNRGMHNIHSEVSEADESFFKKRISILYAYGSTLTVARPGVVMLTTGSVCYPFNRPICAYYNDQKNGGKVVAIGSIAMFEDTYIKCEDNFKLFNMLLYLLSSDGFKLNAVDAQCPDIGDYRFIPSIASLANLPYSCLQETDDLPEDPLKLFQPKLYTFNNSLCPKILRSYKEMGITKRTLSRIVPKFISPLPELKGAHYPPLIKSLPHPSLEMFDLEAEFSAKHRLLARITNKCSDSDLEYYVKECGKILDTPSWKFSGVVTAKEVLEYVLFCVADYKVKNRDFNTVSEIESYGSLKFISISSSSY